MRGEILFETNATDPAAEEAFLAAIAVARNRNPQLRTPRRARPGEALRATGRDADARAVLGPALEGFSPTPEFPEIAEAMETLAVLEANESV